MCVRKPSTTFIYRRTFLEHIVTGRYKVFEGLPQRLLILNTFLVGCCCKLRNVLESLHNCNGCCLQSDFEHLFAKGVCEACSQKLFEICLQRVLQSLFAKSV